jgi:hypothetical protein
MKIIDIDKNNLPNIFKVNGNFIHEETIDKGTIFRITNYTLEKYEDDPLSVVIVDIVIPKEYIPQNKKLCVNDWLDHKTGEYNLNFYDANPEFKNDNGDYVLKLFVMDNEDVFEPCDEESIRNSYFKFAEWLGDNYIKLNKVWCPKYSNQTDEKNYKTTEELYDFWITNFN